MSRRNRRAEIIKAARALFVAKGYENTSVRNILEKADATTGTFYHQFESKQALLVAVIDDIGAEMEQIVAPVMMAQSISAIERYQRLVQADNAYRQAEHGVIYQVWKALESDENWRLVNRLRQKGNLIYIPALTQIIQQGNEEGVFDVVHVSETAELLLHNCRFAQTAFLHIWHNIDQYDDPVASATQKMSVTQTVVDQLVGASLGALLLLDKQAVLRILTSLTS
ncbi:MAG: TetR/AcrR family transcriptional regulator, partial [Chloroflexota bacterium]